jgi:hypothetical protein
MSSSSPLTGVAQNELARKHLQAMSEAVFPVDVKSPAILASKTQTALMTAPPSCRVLESIAAVDTVEAVHNALIGKFEKKSSKYSSTCLIMLTHHCPLTRATNVKYGLRFASTLTTTNTLQYQYKDNVPVLPNGIISSELFEGILTTGQSDFYDQTGTCPLNCRKSRLNDSGRPIA